MLEGILQGLVQWIYGLFLELIAYCANALLGVMSTDLTFWETSVPVVGTLYKIFVAIGWGLLIGNCAFQSLKAMFAGLGFETESPAVLLLRTALFGTLLMFSGDICDIGLSIGKNIMTLIGIPSSVTITTPDESAFNGMGASWLLVIIIGFILGFQLIKLFFEIAERYVVVAVLTLLCPVGLAMGGSKSTKDICTGFIRTYASMIVMMVMNVLFLKLILSALAAMPSGMMILPWCLLVVGIAKTARKADNLISKIGLNPAITGDPLGHVKGGMAAMMAVRTIMNTATKSGKMKSSGGKTGGGSRSYAGNMSHMTRNTAGGNTIGGNTVGGTNIHNGGAASPQSQQSAFSTAANANTNSQHAQNTQNSQSSRFGAPNSTTSAQSASSSRFGAVHHNSASSIGTMTSGGVHVGGTGNTQVNTNRFGLQTSGASGIGPISKAGATHPVTAEGGKAPMKGKATANGKPAAKASVLGVGTPAVKASAPGAGKPTEKPKQEKKSEGKTAPKTAQETARFGVKSGQAKAASAVGLRQNANPFKGAGTQRPSGQLRTNTPAPIHSTPQSRIDMASQPSVNESPASPEVHAEEGGEKNG